MAPVFFKIGNFVVYWYGVMIAIAIIVSSFLFEKFAKEKSYPDNTLERIIFITVFYGLIGARLLSVLINYHYYSAHPFEVLNIRDGALSMEGAVILALISLIIFLKAHKLNVLPTLDMVSLSAPVGQAIGMLGCFLGGCFYGIKTTGIWGVKIPFLAYKVYPVSLFELAGNLIIFLILFLFYMEKHKDGEIVGWYLILYGILRYGLDGLRGDLIPTSFFNLYPAQIFGGILFLIGAFWIFSIMRSKNENYDSVK
ncbi:MAG: prolipoprotein diacylglyceryl transferase [Candidatus Omnitrophica bacterium]|nr:prolipoprotein diacylglyceryl transferase [Candidatus Omnitrophota bacterium]